MGKEEIKQTIAFKFAGKLYETQQDAERALANSDLDGFLRQNWREISVDDEQKQVVKYWLIKHWKGLSILLEALR